jgi:putative membrane protein
MNMNKTLITLGVSLVAINYCLAQDQNSSSMPAPADASASTTNATQRFLWEAATTDLKEIHAANLALEKSDNDDVKHFAKHLVSDHEKSLKKLQSIAEKEGISFPDTNSIGWNDAEETNQWSVNSTNSESGTDTNNYQSGETARVPHAVTNLVSDMGTNTENDLAEHHEMALETLSGAAFDRAFANHMVKGHEKAINKFEAALPNLEDPDLKKYAEKTLPVLHKHLEMAQALQAKVGEASDNDMTNSPSAYNR